MAEEVALQQVGRHRSGVDGDERPLGPARVVVDRLGHQLLAGAALAQDQDVALGRRGELDQVVDLLHRLALADQVVEPEALAELLLQVPVLGGEPPLVQPLADGEHHLFVLERLGDVVEGPLAHRLDGALDRGEGGDHHHHQVGIAPADLAQHLHAVHAGEHEVEEDEVDLLPLQDRQPLLAGGGGERRVPLLADEHGQDVLENLFVVDDQDVHAVVTGAAP